MSKVEALRAFVMARLESTAKEISDFYERLMAENEEELRRSEDENQENQQTLNQVLNPRVFLQRLSPDQIKEEPEWSGKQEEEELPVSIPECTGLCVKMEASSELQQIKSDQREEAEEEDMSSEPHLHSQTEGHKELSSDTDNDDDWEPPLIASAAQKKTEAEGDQQVQVHNRNTKLSSQNKSAAKTSVTVEKGEASGNEKGAERKKHVCFVCHKRFGDVYHLKQHMRIHTGEKPYRCNTCNKAFTLNCTLKAHKRTHTGEKPFRCSTCDKAFTVKHQLETHKRIHTGEKPYRCSTCDNSFTQKIHLERHKRTHTRAPTET